MFNRLPTYRRRDAQRTRENIAVANRARYVSSHPPSVYEQRTYGKLGQRFQRLAGLADSQEGGKSDGHRLPRLQLCLGQSSQRVDAGQEACGGRTGRGTEHKTGGS